MVAVVVAAGMAAVPVLAQTAPQRTLAARAFDLERSGNYAGAVNAYRTLLTEQPTSLPALLGLERALTAMSRLPEMLPEVRMVLAGESPNLAAFGVAIRVWTAAGQLDSAGAVVERWALAEPGSEAPWQEWGMAASSRRDMPKVREIFAAGRARLGRPEALAVEMAQIASMEGNYPVAVREWVVALGASPMHRAGAVALLGQATPERRPEVLQLLVAARSPVATRLAAVLTARWGDPVGGFERLRAALSSEPALQVEELSHFYEEISGSATPGGRRAEALVQEALAERASPDSAARHWLEAAQAYSEAGEAESARRMLGRLATAAGVPNDVAASATLTLVGVLVDEGRLAAADSQFVALQGTLSAEPREQLARRVSRGWLRRGELARAALLVAGDSTVEGHDLAGRIKLFQGDLAGATELLRSAGPFAGTREEASSRLTYLALLQVIADDSVPGLGPGLLRLEQGDTAGAAAQLEEAAKVAPSKAGAAELRLLAGRLHAAQGRPVEAERLLTAAGEAASPASAAAAALELARLEGRTGRKEQAMARLEALILAWPGSTMAPEARRMLDSLRGATPGTP